jgi:hypothetical protein
MHIYYRTQTQIMGQSCTGHLDRFSYLQVTRLILGTYAFRPICTYIYIYVRIQVTRLWIRGAFAFRPVLHRPSWTDVPIQVLRLIFLNPRFHAHPGTRQRKKTKLNKGESFDCKLPGDPFALWVTWKPFVERCLLDVQVAVAYVLITVHRCTPQSSSKRWLPKACPPLYRGQ